MILSVLLQKTVGAADEKDGFLFVGRIPEGIRPFFYLSKKLCYNLNKINNRQFYTIVKKCRHGLDSRNKNL